MNGFGRGSDARTSKATCGTVPQLVLVLVTCVGLTLAHGPAGAAVDAPATADGPQIGPETNLPMPRYVSLRSSEINVRRGPGLDYRKDWVFRRAGLPVRVVDEYGDWRRIEDSDGAGGWVYHSLLTGRRTALIVADEAVLRDAPAPDAKPAARAERGVVARLRACRPSWCRIEVQGIEGWVQKTEIWGADPAESFGQ